MPEDIKQPQTESKPQAMDVVAKPAPADEKPTTTTKQGEAPEKQPKEQSKQPGSSSPRRPVGAIALAILIGGGLIALAIFSQLQ